MKNVLGIALLLLALNNVAFAQNKEIKQTKVMVPTAVKQAFEKQHAAVKAKWD